MTLFRFFIIFLLFITVDNSVASRLKERDYFASLRSSKTNVRVGPAMSYAAKYVLHLKSMPIRVIAEYDNWVEIEDFESGNGWVNKNLITKRKTAMVRTKKDFINLYKANFAKSKILFRLENNVILEVIKCRNNWCYVKTEGAKGWLQDSQIWGYKDK